MYNRKIVTNASAVQTLIKQIIGYDLYNRAPEADTKQTVAKVIKTYSSKCGFTDLVAKRTLILSLAVAFRYWYIFTSKEVKRRKVDLETAKMPLSQAIAEVEQFDDYFYLDKGNVWIDNYRAKVKKEYARIIKELSDSNGLVGKGVSIRQIAEIEARRQATEERIGQMRQSGVKLAWCSTHADCSTRCAPWQGRLYSLDGTAGIKHGNRYVPLETATEIYETTKSGKRWRNGLFGFNCRHFLTDYEDNKNPPQGFDVETIKEERKIDKRQRELERAIRKHKERGFLLRSVNYKEALKEWEKARNLEAAYKNFCLENQRAYYEERLAVMTEEILILWRKQ